MVPKRIGGYLESHRRKHLEKLLELLRIPSIANNDDEHCDRAAEWLATHLEDLGLDARIADADGKPNVLASLRASDEAPTLLIYGHYDVQPPDPLELWRSPPFEPEVRDGWIYARGANDDKGQLFAHMMAIEAYQRGGDGCPVNIKFFIEGEEEIGSPNLESFVASHKDELSADHAVVSDSAFFADGLPSIVYSLRGLLYLELTLRGASRDVHSGLYGGLVANPTNALGRMIAAMHDRNGRVTIPGFYDDVLPLDDAERRAWAELPFDEARTAADLGLNVLAGGENGIAPLERNWARPTLDCNGIVGGYAGPGAKTVIPAEAGAKISMRLVPNQRPERIVAGFREFVAGNTPPGMSAAVRVHAEARPVLLDKDSPAITAGSRALAEAFGSPCVFIRCGASVPVTELIQRLLGLDAALMGFGLPQDRVHSPNERFALRQLYGGAVASAAFMQNLIEASAPAGP